MTDRPFPLRGRLIGSDESATSDAATVRRRALILLACVLPMFAQTFQYVVDTPLLYALSKGWPLLTLPLAVIGATRMSTPFKPLVLILLVWVLGVAPTISVIQLGNTFIGAVSTTLKVWSLTFAFSLPATLLLLRPTEEELRRVLICLGVTTFVLMTLLFLLAPDSAYEQGLLGTKLFLMDETRGKRIYAPMFFGMLLIFMLNRSFWIQPRIWKAAGVILCFALLILIYKQRTAIAAAGICILVGAVLSLRRGRMTVAAILVAAGIGPAILLVHAVTADLQAGFGSSLSVRQMELAAALNFLNDEPLRWLSGVGSITRAGSQSLADIVQTDALYLADLGWIGVVFEYGAIGALLLLGLHVAVIHYCARGAAKSDPLARALLDYSLFILVTSAVYSVVFAPGELMACLGLAWWLQRRTREAKEAEASGRVLWDLALRPTRVGGRGEVLGGRP